MGKGEERFSSQGRQIAITEFTIVESRTTGALDGGKMTLRASESIELKDISADGSLYSFAFTGVNLGGTGRGGDVEVIAPRVLNDGGFDFCPN